MKKVFIACPMHGKSDNYIDIVRKQVSLAVSLLYDEKIEILDQVHIAETADIVAMEERKLRTFRLGRSIQILGQADLVIFTDDYATANGCRVEKFVCQTYQIPFKMYSDIIADLKKDSFKWNSFHQVVNTTYCMTSNNSSRT
jgi:hypothetical protein